MHIQTELQEERGACLGQGQTGRAEELNLMPVNVTQWVSAEPENGNGNLGKKLQGQCFRIVSAESPVKLYCCYGVIAVLIVAVVTLSVALSLSTRKQKQTSIKNTPANCPRNWIGFGSKCFHFSENTTDWTFSQNFCKEQEAQLARFDSLEELEFLNRYKGTFDYWIGLHSESPEHPWMWTDNTEYYGPVLIGGDEEYAYLNNNGISSARVYADRRWICSKPSSYALQCQTPLPSL